MIAQGCGEKTHWIIDFVFNNGGKIVWACSHLVFVFHLASLAFDLLVILQQSSGSVIMGRAGGWGKVGVQFMV